VTLPCESVEIEITESRQPLGSLFKRLKFGARDGSHPMNVHFALGIIASVLVAISSVLYILDIFRGRTRPHPVSWAVWTLIGLLGTAGTIQGRAGPGAFVPLEYLIVCASVFVISMFPGYGKGGRRRYDVPLGIAAATTLIIWQLANWPSALAVGVAIATDASVTWMTLRDGWSNPSSESAAAWSVGAVGALIGVAATQHLTFGAIGYPAFIAFASTVTAVSLLVRSRQPRFATL
jgi:hypothetical protein